VYDALLDAEQARRFMFATTGGRMIRAEIDPRVGGGFIFTDRRGGQDVEHVGHYTELERPRRIAFTFAVDGSAPTAVTIDIMSLEPGCELTLTHQLRQEWAEYLPRTIDGWNSILNALDASLR
jgi:uncharacterized protein YndB with AHSA1/START domain